MQQNIDALWSGMNDGLYAFILKRTKDRDTAQDILQDVYLKIRSKIHALRDHDKITSWIYQVTRNAVVDHFRKTRKEQGPELKEGMEVSDEQVQDETRSLAECIVPMIHSLPPKYKEALLLSEIEGMQQKELAERIGISYSGARSRVQRGREMLKDVLTECCSISTDRYGNIIEYHNKKDCSEDSC